MTGSEVLLLQELELIRKDMLRLARVVESMVPRMRRLEVWQVTMDMTLKNMPENS